MKNITNIEVINVFRSISEYKSLLDSTPSKLTYAVSKHEASLTKHVQDYDAARINLCKEFCEKDSDDNPIMTTAPEGLSDEQKKSYQPQFTFSDENMKLFTEALIDLQGELVEVPDYKAKADVLDNFSFTPAYFPSSSTFLEYFVE